MYESHYEIGILIGPCTRREALSMMEDVAQFVHNRKSGSLGAACGMTVYNEEEEESSFREAKAI